MRQAQVQGHLGLAQIAALMRLQVCTLDTYFTELHWYPLSSKKNQAGGTDVFAVGCTNGVPHAPTAGWAGAIACAAATPMACRRPPVALDTALLKRLPPCSSAGCFKVISRTGRLEKSVDAHAGACISLRWSYDGACKLCLPVYPRLQACAGTPPPPHPLASCIPPHLACMSAPAPGHAARCTNNGGRHTPAGRLAMHRPHGSAQFLYFASIKVLAVFCQY